MSASPKGKKYKISKLESVLGKVSKKVRNFPHFSGVGGFEKVIFRKKNGLKTGVDIKQSMFIVHWTLFICP